MDPLVTTLVLILLALLGARFSFSNVSVPAGPRLLFRTGTHFLFLGFLLGPTLVGLLSGQALRQLLPLMALGLGWVGFLFGVQLDRAHLREFPWSFHLFALGQAVVAFALFAALAWVGLDSMGSGGEVSTLLVLGAAATACVSAPAGIAMVSTNFMVRGPLRRLLFYVASVDAVVGVLALQVTYALFHPTDVILGLPRVTALGWVVVASGLGVISGILFLWLTRTRVQADELVLYLLGITAFSSGAALHLQLSPLFVSMIMGAVVVNLSPDREQIYDALQKWEKPTYVVLLLLAGALLRFPTAWIVALGAGYALLRAGAKATGGLVMSRVLPLEGPPPMRVGLGLIFQGGISIAMAVSCLLTFQGMGIVDGSRVDIFFGTVILGVILAELAGPFFTTGVLRRAGEISPRVEEALARGDEAGAHQEAVRHGLSGPEGEPDA